MESSKKIGILFLFAFLASMAVLLSGEFYYGPEEGAMYCKVFMRNVILPQMFFGICMGCLFGVSHGCKAGWRWVAISAAYCLVFIWRIYSRGKQCYFEDTRIPEGFYYIVAGEFALWHNEYDLLTLYIFLILAMTGKHRFQYLALETLNFLIAFAALQFVFERTLDHMVYSNSIVGMLFRVGLLIGLPVCAALEVELYRWLSVCRLKITGGCE